MKKKVEKSKIKAEKVVPEESEIVPIVKDSE